MGKPLAQARAEVMKCVDGIALLRRERRALPRAAPGRGLGGLRDYVRYDPIGTVLAIMPWNFPYWQPIRMIAPVVAAGNTLSSRPPRTRWGPARRSSPRRGGLPAGVVQTLRVEPDVIADVIADPRIQGVSFTGSTRGGRAVAAVAGAHGKRTVLELGGSDPFVVLADADVARAGAKAATRGCSTAGRAASRPSASSSTAVADDFTEAMAAGSGGGRG
jgi:succinate-semialdehyde dehydrogenase / glutarate-semialdehyde dehydrogenase